jgi:hypothetical protein
VRLIVPFPAGGQIDIIVRLIGQWLREFISLLGALSAACDLPACFYAKAGGLDSYGNDFQPISEVS